MNRSLCGLRPILTDVLSVPCDAIVQVPKLKEIAKDGIDFAVSRKEKKTSNGDTVDVVVAESPSTALVSATSSGWGNGHQSVSNLQGAIASNIAGPTPALVSAGESQEQGVEDIDSVNEYRQA